MTAIQLAGDSGEIRVPRGQMIGYKAEFEMLCQAHAAEHPGFQASMDEASEPGVTIIRWRTRHADQK